MAWHPNLHNRRIHPASTCTKFSVSMPKPHLATLNELAKLHRTNRSAIIRRLVECVVDGVVPPEVLAPHPRPQLKSMSGRDAKQ